MSFTNGLSPGMPDFVEERMTKERLSSWDDIAKQGQRPNQFHYLGQAVVGGFRVLSNSNRVLVNKYQNGSLLGLTALRAGRDWSFNLVPLTDGVMYSGDETDLAFFREHHPDEFRRWVDSRESSSQDLYRKIDQLLSLELRQRMAIELLELADCLGKRNGRGVTINTRLSRNRLSNILGCAHESVSRIMSQWDADSVIRTDEKLITLLEPGVLATQAPESFELPSLTGLNGAG